MKLKKTNEIKENKEIKYKKKFHNKNASEDLNILKNVDSNYFISKFLNNKNINTGGGGANINKIKNEILKKENLPNLKTNIQNIFANDDKKQKAIQYLIKIRKERNSSPSTDFKKILASESTRDIFVDKKEKDKEKGIEITPYNIRKNRYIHHVNKPIITSYNLSQNNFYIKNKEKENSQSKKKEKQNINFNNAKSPFSNNNNNIYKNIFNTNNNTINNTNSNKRIHINKNNSNKTYDNLINKENNPININENYNNTKINNNAYTNYIKNSNISKLKIQLLNEKEISNYSLINNKQKNNNNNNNINNNNNDNSFYIHKKPISIYTKRNFRNAYTDRDILNSNILIKEIGNNKNRNYIATEIRKNDYKINNSKDNKSPISLNESINNKKNIIFKEPKKFNNKDLFKINYIQFSIISKIKNEKIKNNYKINNNFRFNIKGINNNKNKFIFNNESEVIEYIKNKYNKQKDSDIGDNKIGLISIEQANKIKEKNEKLMNEINKLKYENKQYKKELVDIRNQFNDLSKEIIIIKEENEKLKDNIINNMINDENNDEFS